MDLEQLPEIEKLENKFRVLLQAEVLKKVLGEKSTTPQRNDWLTANASRMSDIIDGQNEASIKIRDLARQEKYEEAAEMLKDLFNQEELKF